MKKMMMIFAVLFVMVGSSLGSDGYVWNFDETVSSNNPHLKTSKSIRVYSVSTSAYGESFNIGFTDSPVTGVMKFYNIDAGLPEAVKKSILAILLSAYNNETYINILYKNASPEVVDVKRVIAVK